MKLPHGFARILVRAAGVAGLLLPLAVAPSGAQQEEAPGQVRKNGLDVDIRSSGRVVAEEVAEFGASMPTEEESPVPGQTVVPQIQLRRGNIQTNDGSLDNIQIFNLFRPFVKFTQSETSIAAYGPNIVATYNTSANQPLVQTAPGVLQFVRRFLSGFSTSNDGGKTWTSGFLPPLPGSIFTFGDPVVDNDRAGNFYFAGLGANASGLTTIQVNKSTDGGRTWSAAVLVQQDNGGDKEWLAVGPDPFDPTRDNVYVTWTSFQAVGRQLRFGRSTDGGATFTAKTIFTPAADPDPTHAQNTLQYSNPYVDPLTGRLYVPFLQFSNSDQDFIRIMVSDDAGETFSFVNFNVAGAFSPSVLPVTQAGELIDCRSGGTRLAIHTGPDVGGRFGLRSFVQATRLVTQPAFAARNGVLYLAWSNSTSTVFGDPNAGSNILFIRSTNGGLTWSAPIQVNPTVAGDVHHVLPALATDSDGNGVHVSYYTQHTDGTVDLDMANSKDRGQTFPLSRTVRVTSTPFTLAPTNIPLTASTSTNYDRLIVACYSLGEYQSVASANGSVHVLWGDERNSVTEPTNPLNPLSGQTHSQQDVFYQKVKAQ